MKPNPYDRISNRILDIVEKVSDKVAKEFKNTNPYDQVPMTDEEIMNQFNQLSLEEKMRIINQMGGKR